MARPNRSTHLVAVAAVAVVVAASTVAGCLGLAATKREKYRLCSTKAAQQKRSAFSFLSPLFPHVQVRPEPDQRQQQPRNFFADFFLFFKGNFCGDHEASAHSVFAFFMSIELKCRGSTSSRSSSATSGAVD